MSRRMFFGTFAGFMFIALSFALPSTSLAQEGTWTAKADMPTARSWFSTSVVNGKIYAIGGWTRSDPSATSAVEEYNPTTDTWTKKADLPAARAYLSTCAVDGKIYVIGGADGGSRRSRVEQYDPATDQWTSKADMLTLRNNLDTSVVNGKIYAIGGHTGGGTTAKVEEYDPATDRWVRKADMPTSRYTLSTSVVNGKIYAIGGGDWDNNIGVGITFSAVEEYDPATDTWTAKAALPMPTFEPATVVVNGKIYVMGGTGTLTETFGADETILSTIMKYDPATDTWTKEGDMRFPRTAHSASVVAGRIYVIGGHEVLVRPISSVEAYQAVPSDFAYDPNPVDGAIYPDTWVNLSWGPGDFAVSHDVYFGDHFDDVNEGVGDTFRGNQAVTFFNAGFPESLYPDGLVRGATYYWRVDEVTDAEPDSPWIGSVWSFTIQRKIAFNPAPADGAELVDMDIELSWKAGLGAALHTVYFGDDFDDVNNATGDLKQVERTYTPGPLELSKTYYWRVDEQTRGRGAEMRKGDVWSFTTADFLVVDDFEDYDVGNNEIWWSWKDGLGYAAHDNKPAHSGNGTGSAVGDEMTPSYTEETIVHGGNQSMPLAYDNNKQGYSNYSEAEMTLNDLRNWTVEGVGVLTIWFHGAASNGAETLYVVLNGNTVVTHDNPNAAQIETWTQWDIDLQAFADLGVDLANVDTIALGFGDRNNPQPGGIGLMYFDDIRLVRPTPPPELEP